MLDMATPRNDRYFGDYPVGRTFEYGTIAVTEDDIVRFASEFDPQSKHIDKDAAERGAFGGLIASGWHTVCLVMRLLVDNYFSSVADIASPGVDEVRWTKPVRPGDILSVRVTVLEARISKSKPDRGIVSSLIEARNQNGDLVLSFKGLSLLRRRESSEFVGLWAER